MHAPKAAAVLVLAPLLLPALSAGQAACNTARQELEQARALLTMPDSAAHNRAELLIKRALELCKTDSGVLRLAAKAFDDLGDDVQAAYYRAQGDKLDAAGKKSEVDLGPAPPDVDQAPRSRIANAEHYGVIIGIQHYPRASEVSFAETDAGAMRDYFGKTLGVRDTHLKVLLGDQATTANIRAAVQWAAASAKPGSNLYLYYAGHGLPDIEENTNLLVPYDFDPNRLQASVLRLDQVYAELNKTKADRVVVFMDSCFSGAAARGEATDVVIPGQRAAFVDVSQAPPQKLFVLAAASAKQASNAYSRAQHGLFTYHLLSALHGGVPPDATGAVSLKAIADYVTAKVQETAAKMQRQQIPKLSSQDDPSQVMLIKWK